MASKASHVRRVSGKHEEADLASGFRTGVPRRGLGRRSAGHPHRFELVVGRDRRSRRRCRLHALVRRRRHGGRRLPGLKSVGRGHRLQQPRPAFHARLEQAFQHSRHGWQRLHLLCVGRPVRHGRGGRRLGCRGADLRLAQRRLEEQLRLVFPVPSRQRRQLRVPHPRRCLHPQPGLHFSGAHTRRQPRARAGDVRVDARRPGRIGWMARRRKAHGRSGPQGFYREVLSGPVDGPLSV